MNVSDKKVRELLIAGAWPNDFSFYSDNCWEYRPARGRLDRIISKTKMSRKDLCNEIEGLTEVFSAYTAYQNWLYHHMEAEDLKSEEYLLEAALLIERYYAEHHCSSG